MKVLRIRSVCKLLEVSRTTLWRWERSGQFVARRQLGPGVVGYLEDDVVAWLSARPRLQPVPNDCAESARDVRPPESIGARTAR